MIITLTNSDIYDYANKILEEFSDNTLKLPLKVNFYLQKNKREILILAQDIEDQRLLIAKEYGILDKDTNQYNIPKEKIQEVQNEIKKLFDLTQEVNIYKISLNDFENVELTSGQMEAILFMIEDE